MGTRSLTRVLEKEKGAEIICLYRQFDGYPGGMGLDIFNAFKDWGFCNGFSDEGQCAKCNKSGYENVHTNRRTRGYHEFEHKKFSNGIYCFAATLVKELKEGIGNVYLYPPKTKEAWQEYEYHLWLASDVGPLMMKVLKPAYKGHGPEKSGAHPEIVLYRGPIADFTPDKCKTDEERAEEAAEAAAEKA